VDPESPPLAIVWVFVVSHLGYVVKLMLGPERSRLSLASASFV